jgi:hypothetical protein
MIYCPECGLSMGPSEILGDVFLKHKPHTAGEVLRALRCPLFGVGSLRTTEEPDIPSIYRTTGHFNAMWRRSP